MNALTTVSCKWCYLRWLSFIEVVKSNEIGDDLWSRGVIYSTFFFFSIWAVAKGKKHLRPSSLIISIIIQSKLNNKKILKTEYRQPQTVFLVRFLYHQSFHLINCVPVFSLNDNINDNNIFDEIIDSLLLIINELI